MNLESIFSAASLLAMTGWLFLLASPLTPNWSNKIAGFVIPIVLSAGYVILTLFFSPGDDGGYGSLADVAALFSHQQSLLAGWVHFLAFDLLIGAWMCRTARQEHLNFWLVIPCLLLTFLLGPAGFLLFSVLHGLNRTKRSLRNGK